jgi:hypothetical protein
MKTVIESFKINSPSLAGSFVTICDLKVLFHGAPKKILTKKKVIGRSPDFRGPVGKIPPYMAGPPLVISNIELLPKFTSEDVTSPEASILLMLIRSAATYISKSVAYASEV